MTLQPEAVDLGIYLIGWSVGWALLWQLRPLRPDLSSANIATAANTPNPANAPELRNTPEPTNTPRSGTAPDLAESGRLACAVIIPARDEVDAIADVLAPLLPQLRPGDEIVVVDDRSTDGTAAVADRLGARVVSAPEPPPGWLGKPHACWIGSCETTAPILLFIDADVSPAADLVDRVVAEVVAHPGAVVSVQPWHATGSIGEQASVFCNIAALMGSGAFTAAGSRLRPNVAFGPVLSLQRCDYDAVGGHAAPGIRHMHTEDIGLARAVGRSEIFSGAPDTTFRMYPGGLRQTVAGWTRSLVAGARFTRWPLALATLAWIWSLAGGVFVTPLAYPLSVLQVWWLGRRAVNIRPLTALLYPVALAVFVLIFIRSAVKMVFGHDVVWKGRHVASR